MISILTLGISLLSAMVSIAALLMAWANVQRQIRKAAREAWLRDFREQVSALLAGREALDAGPEDPQREAEIKHALRSAYHRIRLLLADESETALIKAFASTLETFMRLEANDRDAPRALFNFAENFLRHQRSMSSLDLGVWTTLGFSLGLGAVYRAAEWRPWSRFVAWCRRLKTPPRFPDAR